MDPVITLLTALVGAAVGFGIGHVLKQNTAEKERLQAQAESEKLMREAQSVVSQAQNEAQKIEREAKDLMMDAKQQTHDARLEAERQSARLEEQEKKLSKDTQELERQTKNLQLKEQELTAEKESLRELKLQEQEKLEEIADMTAEKAQERLFQNVEQLKEQDLLRRMRALDHSIEHEVEEKAKKALSEAIQRFASDVTSEITQTTVSLPSDDIKGRIIGREGRNINALERATGVDIIIDDTPGVIILSGYDLMRRYIAKRAIEKLVEDGRINPARIEEEVQKATTQTESLIAQFGQKACEEVGITGIPVEVQKVVGRLRFRQSYGQNVLQHSIEVAFIAEELANIVGADAQRAKTAGLLHDMGKAISHEVGGRHAVISAEIARKFGMEPLMINAIEAHHEDVEKECIEAYLVQAADAISASRPGARRDSAEQFVKRMKAQESVVERFEGVTKSYIMSSGREMWVFVEPKKISDLEAKKMADEIARALESELRFPGEIKVTVFRETRVQAVAR